MKKRAKRKKRTFWELQKTHFQKKSTKNGQNGQIPVCNARVIYVKKHQKMAFLAVFRLFLQKSEVFFFQILREARKRSPFLDLFEGPF